MGLLSEGTPLSWADVQASGVPDTVRHHGILQFLSIYRRLKDRRGDCLKFGDEVEYIIATLIPSASVGGSSSGSGSNGNSSSTASGNAHPAQAEQHEQLPPQADRTARVCLRAQYILEQLGQEEHHVDAKLLKMLWRPEYGRFMIEGTPGQPYAGSISDFLTVESNMRLRRETVQALLRPNEVALTVTNFPLLGTPNFTEPPAAPRGPAARSLFFPDEAINAHRRFPTLTQNIRERRGKRVAINMPVFRDVNTPKPFAPKYDDEEADAAALPEHIYMDAMGFGMGCCCLQVTFQACSIDEARHLYDQLAVIAPVMLALTAATPIFRGYLADVDCRWNTISQSVDDRTQEEQGKAPLKSSRFVIPKSRYDSIDSYISQDPALRASHNDIPLVMDHGHYATLRNGGVDHLLAQHVAHLFIRDPLVVYRERLNQDDENESDHFENIQSTNWQTMRFKPPPPNSSIGWRVEFRVMEVQLTDFENAAFTLFIVLLTRAILSFDLLFYIPISKVDENMQTAQKRDAVSSGKFFFRKNLTRAVDDDSYELMDVNTIINGQEGAFPGLLPLLNQYLDSMEIDFQSRSLLASYFELISKRASGELITTAKWMREFVQQHPEYKKDSVVSGPIAFDLVKLCADLGNGIATAERLLGPLPTQPAQ